MIDGGCRLRARVIGAVSAMPYYGARFQVHSTKESPLDVTLEYEHRPSTSMKVVDIARYVRVDNRNTSVPVIERPFVERPFNDVPCLWLTVTARKAYSVDPDLERRFFEDPQATMPMVSKVLSGLIKSRVLPDALITLGIQASRNPGAVFRIEIEQELYWYSADRAESTTVGEAGETIAEVDVDQASLNAGLWDTVSVLSGTNRDVLERVFHHYLKGRQELPGSLDRFLSYFMALESLTSLAKVKPDLSFERGAASLRQLVKDAAPDTKAFVAGLLNRPPSINTRFRSLAEWTTLPSLTEDVRAFRDMNALRSEFAHGRQYDPKGEREVLVSDRASGLLLTYLTAAMSRLRSDAIREGRIVLPSA